MKKLTARAYAKINLGLEVLAKRDDGYHELRTILQTVDLHDDLVFRAKGEGIELKTDAGIVPGGSGNLVHRAATRLAEAAEIRVGATIELRKNVPVGAGLGGGSADAAVTLMALDRLWDLNTPPPTLHRLAGSLGMDVPFFLYGGCALAVGRGDELYPLKYDMDRPIVLILPDFSVSTADAYSSLRLTNPVPDRTLQHFAWNCFDVHSLRKLVNNLEDVSSEHSASIQEYKEILLSRGAQSSMMSGSGSAVYGIFEKDDAAQSAASSLSREGIRAVATRTLTGDAYRRRWFSGGDE